MMYEIAVTNDFSFCLKETIYFTTGEKKFIFNSNFSQKVK